MSLAIERADHVLGRHGRQAHQLDEVARVLAIRAQREPPDPRMVRRQPRTWPKLGFDQRRFVGQSRYEACEPSARGRRRAGPAARCARSQRRAPVAGDGRSLDDARSRAADAGAAPRGAAPRVAVGGHRAAVATLAFAPAIRLRACLTGASVPTSVSLSSPRMNASTRLNAMSSWICCGGLFMK